MIKELQTIFDEVIGSADIELTDKTKIKDLPLSSLGLIKLICDIEDRYNIEISNSEIKKFKAVKDVILCLEKKVNNSDKTSF